MKILVHANCQNRPIADLFEAARPDIEVLRIPPIHLLTKDHVERVQSAAKLADYILMQPMSDVFGEFGSSGIKAVATGKLVTFNSIYFSGPFPYLTYLRKPEGGSVVGPLIDYHDSRILRAYISGKTQSECLASFDEESEPFCRSTYEKSISELKGREAGVDIKLVRMIEENISNKCLFYTFNHPSNDILWEVVKQFLAIAGEPVPDGDVPSGAHRLDKIIAKSGPKLESMYGITSRDNYILDGAEIHSTDIIDRYYKIYDETPDIVSIAARNQITSDQVFA